MKIFKNTQEFVNLEGKRHVLHLTQQRIRILLDALLSYQNKGPLEPDDAHEIQNMRTVLEGCGLLLEMRSYTNAIAGILNCLRAPENPEEE